MASLRLTTAVQLLLLVAIFASLPAEPRAETPRRELKILKDLVGQYALTTTGTNVTSLVLSLNVSNPLRSKKPSDYVLSFQATLEMADNALTVTDPPKFFMVFSNGHLYYLNSGTNWTLKQEYVPTCTPNPDYVAPPSSGAPEATDGSGETGTEDTTDVPAEICVDTLVKTTHILEPSIFTGRRSYFSKKDYMWTDWNMLGCPDMYFRFGIPVRGRVSGLLAKIA
ncbi:unnamed protein product [Closterium sp. NIES-64]|nr:unnamed protein product [Closterium sp. NIES-65]CAI5968428.1 unnamed protein product [Closterium sp. NIES-64]CAI5979142.1 unnamed protein product [Closterium sp. NIES-65]